MKTTYKNCRVRPRFQRAFLLWFQENRHRFALRIHLVGRTRGWIKMRIEGAPDIVSVEVLTNDLMVFIEEGRTYFDVLADFEVLPERVDGGYFCALTSPGCQAIYQDLPVLWRVELYERFLQWFNDKFVSAVSLCIFRMGNGITGSELVYGEVTTHPPSVDMRILAQRMSFSGYPMFDPETEDDIFMKFYPLGAHKAKCWITYHSASTGESP